MKRFAFVVLAIGCSSPSTKPVQTVAPPVVPPPATAVTTCKEGQALGEVKRYEHGVRTASEQEVGRYTVEAGTQFPVEVQLGDKTFKIASPVRRCDGDGRMHFLGLQVEANGLRTIGFTPPQVQYDGFSVTGNSCQVNPVEFCKAKPSDMKCRTMHSAPVFYECSNPIMHELSRATEPPTDEQKKKGITEVLVVDRLVVREYVADIANGTWQNLVIVRETKREEVNPAATDAN